MTLKPRTSREKVSDISEGVNISEIIEVQNALAQSIESRGSERDHSDELMFHVLQYLKQFTIHLQLLRDSLGNIENFNSLNETRTSMIEAQDRAIYFFRLSYPESKLAQYSTELLRITLYTNTLDFCRKYIAWRSNGIDRIQQVVKGYVDALKIEINSTPEK